MLAKKPYSPLVTERHVILTFRMRILEAKKMQIFWLSPFCFNMADNVWSIFLPGYLSNGVEWHFTFSNRFARFGVRERDTDTHAGTHTRALWFEYIFILN